MEALLNMRRLPLKGCLNVRDLGGYPCQGGVTRWHVFLRSAGPEGMTAEDVAMLKAYGITDTTDLRSRDEAAHKPSALSGVPGIKSHHVPMLDHLMSNQAAAEKTPFPKTLAKLYLSMLKDGAADFAQVFRIFAASAGGCLFHCAVGKDRTGMVAMLLLKLAGVANEDVTADYITSEIYLEALIAPQRSVFEQMGLSTDLLGSAASNISLALQALQTEYGGAQQYLLDAGVGQEEIDVVRARLVDKQP